MAAVAEHSPSIRSASGDVFVGGAQVGGDGLDGAPVFVGDEAAVTDMR